MLNHFLNALNVWTEERPGPCHCKFAIVLVSLLIAACSPAPSPLLPPGAEGIDVSHHNGRIAWPKVAASGISFAYIKATEGRGLVDPRFQENWRGASAAGVQPGAYHFYLLCEPADAQAANFIRQVEVRTGTLPPAVDLEHAHNCPPPGTREETLDGLRTFLAALSAEYGATPVIYTTPAFHAEWLEGEGFDAYPLWVRAIGDTPPALPYAIWQYDMRGRVPGIAGNVDRNRAGE